MITRHATKVVAWTTMPRSATKWHSRASPEGPAKRDRAASSATTATQLASWVPASRFGVASSFGKTLLLPPRSPPDFAATRTGRGFAGDLLCQAPSEGHPKALAEGPAKRDRPASGCNDRAKSNLGRQHPASRSHLPSEDTAPLSAIAPFASSPFAHLIPQSCRRACEGLFNGSLRISQ